MCTPIDTSCDQCQGFEIFDIDIYTKYANLYTGQQQQVHPNVMIIITMHMTTSKVFNGLPYTCRRMIDDTFATGHHRYFA